MLIKIMRGVIKFQKEISDEIRDIYDELSREGQHPDTFLLTCSDSRVMPELVTQGKPGELFVQRNVGNIMPPFDELAYEQENISSEAAALEFAVSGLKVKNIIICGHADCGAMKTLIKPNSELPYVTQWVHKHAHAAFEYSQSRGENKDLTSIIKQNILAQIEHLKTYPIVREKIRKGELTLHAWYFDFESKRVFIYEPQCNDFVDLQSALHYAIEARRNKVVQSVAYQFLTQSPISNAQEYCERRALLNSLKDNLKPIWDAIKEEIKITLAQELDGLFSSSFEFEMIVEQGAELKLDSLNTLEDALNQSQGYYHYVRGARSMQSTTQIASSINESSIINSFK